MSAAAINLPTGLPWFKAPFGVDFNSWPRAARRLWEFFRAPQHQGADRFRFRDWEMANALGVRRRVIQKGLRILERLGLIDRSWEWGHDGARVITIMLRLAGPKSEEKSEEGNPKPAAKGKRATKPTACGANGVRPTDATPEEVAAVQQQLGARAAADLERTPTPEETAALNAFLEQSRKRREAAEKAKAAEEARAAAPRISRSKEEVLAQIAALKERHRPGPEEPPPEPRPPDPGG